MGKFMPDYFPIFSNHIFFWERKYGANTFITAIDIIHGVDIVWLTGTSSHLIRKTNMAVFCIYLSWNTKRTSQIWWTVPWKSFLCWLAAPVSQSEGVSTVPLPQKHLGDYLWGGNSSEPLLLTLSTFNHVTLRETMTLLQSEVPFHQGSLFLNTSVALKNKLQTCWLLKKYTYTQRK